ncbi:MAG: hypothetical protein KAS32_05450 [Candidatus Peribacteraceae bacterium]|nr:hypothetical protein [Candidatus Peribacteraceae bacterium]
MAILNVTEYQLIGRSPGRGVYGDAVQAPVEPALVSADVAISGTSAQSAAFNAQTSLVRLCADVNCRVLFSTSPTALATSKRLPAGLVETVVVSQGSSLKVAVIEE